MIHPIAVNRGLPLVMLVMSPMQMYQGKVF